MIFELRCSVGDLAASCEDELEEVFSKLVDADRAGRHFAVFRREVCTWAVENLSLARRERTHLGAIGEQYATRGGLLDAADGFVSVVIGDSGVAVDEQRGFSIGHRALIEGEYLSKCTSFVVEDVKTDGRMYTHVLNEARKVSRIPSFALDPIHGGGGSTNRVFDSEIEKRRVVVCIVDHDRLAPMDRRSATARAVLKNHRDRNCGEEGHGKPFIGVAMTTIGREAENVIPCHVFRAVCPEYRDFDKLNEVLAREGEGLEIGESFWQYFDVKKGIDGKKIMARVRRGDISDDTVRWIGDKLGCDGEGIDDVSVGGFGSNVIQRFLDNPEGLNGFRAFIRTGCWREGFGEYFDRLLWFFAAPARSRT